MKIILFIALLAGGWWLARHLMVQGQKAEEERRANAAVRYTRRLNESERKAQGAAEAANRVISEQSREVNQAAEAGQ